MFSANITRDEAARRSEHLTTQSYDVLVDLSGRAPDGTPLEAPETHFVSTTRVRFHADDYDTDINLIADKVYSASLDGHELLPEAFDGEHLEFYATDGDHELVVTALCRYSRTGEGLHRFVDPVDDRVYLYTQFESADARRMFACFDQPDQKATFAFTVIAPASGQVLSNSAAVEPTPLGDGFARWEFAPTPRISPYITAICVGEFHTVHDVYPTPQGDRPLSISVRQSLAEHLDAERIFTTTKRGFEVFEEAFGRPYAFDDYAQVFVPEFNFGAMENAGCVTFRDEYIFRSRMTAANYESRDNTILHEMAHMWFGDLVTMWWWDDLWLNESFAEWASHYAQQQIAARYGTGVDPWSSFGNQRKTWAYRQDQLPSTHPIAADMVDLEAVELNFDGITYAKGASALRQLVAFVGEDAFLAGVRAYFAEHAWGNTHLDDLLVKLEEASGRDLSFYTQQWLQTTGVNTVAAEFDTDDEGRFTRVSLRQTATAEHPTLRQHRIGVGLYNLVDGRLERTDRVELDLTSTPDAGGDGLTAHTDVDELVGKQRPDLLLLNDDDLTYAKIRLDDRSLATLVGNIEKLESPLARSLCWGAAWDMCRDAEFAPSDYVDLVLRGVGIETDLTAVSAVLAQARTAIDQYSARDRSVALADRFSGGVARLLKQAEPGSDHQLALARAVSSSIRDEVGAAVLKAWLAGEEVPPGLAMDADLRWRVLTDLARVGAIEGADIDAEARRDATATGAEKAAGARSALKSAESKELSWRRAVAEDTPNETHVQICGQFVQRGQDDLLAPYAEKYLDVIAAMSDGRDGWGDKSSAIRQHVVSMLFPRTVADHAFLDRLDGWLAEHPLNDFVGRLFAERCDDARRALRCQQADAARR
ncbi:aminopeptidase N [Nigerium massiliense]|uniref:aminopeptidase N n=1 Tax=Nigerium massiliense TaxID=1522317 RepID=UPI00059177A9|nr:aminopeptidase N [Nigerium massiliense]